MTKVAQEEKALVCLDCSQEPLTVDTLIGSRVECKNGFAGTSQQRFIVFQLLIGISLNPCTFRQQIVRCTALNLYLADQVAGIKIAGVFQIATQVYGDRIDWRWSGQPKFGQSGSDEHL